MKFLIFYIFSSPYNQLVISDVIVFPLAAFVLFRDLSHKNARLNHAIAIAPSSSAAKQWFEELVEKNRASLVSSTNC